MSFGTYTRAASLIEGDFFKLGFNSCIFVNVIRLRWSSTSCWSLLASCVRVFSVFRFLALHVTMETAPRSTKILSLVLAYIWQFWALGSVRVESNDKWVIGTYKPVFLHRKPTLSELSPHYQSCTLHTTGQVIGKLRKKCTLQWENNTVQIIIWNTGMRLYIHQTVTFYFFYYSFTAHCKTKSPLISVWMFL